jgi:hypothetical protein
MIWINPKFGTRICQPKLSLFCKNNVNYELFLVNMVFYSFFFHRTHEE